MEKSNWEQSRVDRVWAVVRPSLAGYSPTVPVDAGDVIEAEVRSLGWSEKMVLDGNFAAVKVLAEQIADSIAVTIRGGQPVRGIGNFSTKGDIVPFISQKIVNIIDSYSFNGKEEVPEGCVAATVTKTFSGMFLATPDGGGKSLIVRFDPSGSIHVMDGDRVVLRPTGRIDKSRSGAASNPEAEFVRKM